MAEPQMLVREQLAHNRWGLLASQGFLLGIDIGGYGLRAALIDLQQHTYASTHRELRGETPEEIVPDVLNLVQGLLESHEVQADHLVRVGVGFSGPVDSRSGKTLLSPRMRGWENYPLKDRIEDAFDVVTLVDNDANLIALAEATFGVAHGKHHLFYLHLSSGVGGGMVIDGHLYHGASTTAGEIGHAPIIPADASWQGRQLGTLEQHVSIGGLLNRAAELGLPTNDLDQIFNDGPVGRQVVAEAVELLAFRLAQVIGVLNPELVVLGGIVVRKGGDAFLNAISEHVKHYTVAPIDLNVPIMASILGFESIAIGGLALGLSSLQE